MKKRTTYPDGRVEEIEGTAEEFAALEGRSPHVCMPCLFPHLTIPPAPVSPWWQQPVSPLVYPSFTCTTGIDIAKEGSS